MATEFWEKNRRALIGLAVFGLLIAANVAVRLGGGRGATPEPVPGPWAPPTPVLVVPGASVSAPATGKAAWDQVLQRMNDLEGMLDGIPAVLPDSLLVGPFDTPARNIFAWGTPAPAEPAATAAVAIASLTPVASAPLIPVLIGQVRRDGKTHLMFREGERVFFLREGDALPEAEYTFVSAGTGPAVIRERSGQELEIKPTERAPNGLEKALAVLRGQGGGLPGFRVRSLATTTEKVQNRGIP